MVFLICWLAFLLSPPPQTSIYHVVHVRGIILNQSKNDTVSVGDKLSAIDKLVFKTPKATATILSPGGGRFTLGLPAARQSSNTEHFMNVLKDVLVGEPSIAKLSTRGLAVDKIVDIKSVFSADTLVFLGNRSRLILETASHPLSSSQYFMYRYTYQQDKTARKRIPFRGDTLIFDKKILYTHNSVRINPDQTGEVEIHKVNMKEQSSMLMGSFKPVFVPDEQLKAELQVVWDVLKDEQKPDNEIIDQMFYHVVAVYGETNKNMLKLWVVEHLKM